mmetsp:Transcript_70752/g.229388  ORF Transcript_70752/g.229388 Transcript_70752/m.229388 type:complete len:215 (+) Transcript_70752:1030-1674(+)
MQPGQRHRPNLSVLTAHAHLPGRTLAPRLRPQRRREKRRASGQRLGRAEALPSVGVVADEDTGVGDRGRTQAGHARRPEPQRRRRQRPAQRRQLCTVELGQEQAPSAGLRGGRLEAGAGQGLEEALGVEEAQDPRLQVPAERTNLGCAPTKLADALPAQQGTVLAVLIELKYAQTHRSLVPGPEKLDSHCDEGDANSAEGVRSRSPTEARRQIF